MTLPKQLQAGLVWIAEFLDQWIPRSVYAIGGGTVLAARWHHRLSTDIDLFAEEDALSDALNSNTWVEISEALTQQATMRTISELVLSPNGFSCKLPSGPISFYSNPHLTPMPISREQEDSTGVHAEHTTEILFKKLRGRMVNASRYLARDLYDLVVCYGVDKESLDAAMAVLSTLERDSLSYDVQRGDTNVLDLDRVLQPAYPALIADLTQFNRVAGEVLARNVSATTEGFLNDIGITALDQRFS